MKNIKDTQELKFMNIGDKQIAFAEINGARWFVTRDVAAYICASATTLNLHIRHSFPNITTATRFDKCGKNGVRVFKERYLVKQAFLEDALADIHFGNKKCEISEDEIVPAVQSRLRRQSKTEVLLPL